MNYKKLIFFIFTFLPITFILLHASMEKPVKVGVYDNYPKVYEADDGSIKGIFPEILQEIAAREDWELDFVKDTWSNCLQNLRSGKLDIMVDVALSESREQIFDFNRVSVLISWGCVYTSSHEEINSIPDLAGKTIAVMKNSILTNGEDGIYNQVERYEVDCEFREVEDYYRVFELLDSHQVDAGIVNRQFGAAFEDRYEVEKSNFIFYPTQLRFAFPKAANRNIRLIERIDANLKKMQNDMNSEFYNILSSYKLYPAEKLPGWIIPVICSLLGLIIFFLILYKGLKWQIKKQTQLLQTANRELKKEIEEHRDTQQELEQSREYYRSFVENIPGLVFMYDQDASGNRVPIIQASRNAEFLGEKIAEEIKKDYNKFFDYIVPEDREKLQEHSSEIAGSHKNLDFEYRVRISEDKVRWFRTIGRVRKLENGNLRWQGVILDIDDRKRAEEALQLAAFRWQSTFDASNDSICILDKDQLILQANKASRKIFDLSPGELIDRYCFKLVHNTEEPVEDCPFVRMKRSLKRETKELELEDGRWLLVTVDPIFDEENELIGGVHNVREITERKIAERKLNLYRTQLENLVESRTKDLEQKTEELKKANIELLEADKLKSIFLASMSHELRTPLNSIIGFTGILLMGMVGDLTEEQRTQLKIIKESAKHLLELINDILDISKIESGKMELSTEKFYIDDVIKEVVDSLQHKADEKGIELTCQLPGKIAQYSDRRRTKQIIINLLSNAVKFTEEGVVTIKAKLSAKEKVKIIVEDTGIGIKKGDMKKLFEPFQQIDSSLTKKYEGTGLGLHLTLKILHILKGSIDVESEAGKGTKFTVTLPLFKEEKNEKSSVDRR